MTETTTTDTACPTPNVRRRTFMWYGLGFVTLVFIAGVTWSTTWLVQRLRFERIISACKMAETVPEQVAVFNAHCGDTKDHMLASIERAVAEPRAIVCVHVDWSLPILWQQPTAEFLLEYRACHPDHPIPFYYVNCTSITSGYEPLRAIDGWKELEKKRNKGSLLHGWGELVWLKNGRVCHVETAFRRERDHMLEITERCFL